MSAFGNVEVVGVRCRGKSRKTWRECVNDDMEELGLTGMGSVQGSV